MAISAQVKFPIKQIHQQIRYICVCCLIWKDIDIKTALAYNISALDGPHDPNVFISHVSKLLLESIYCKEEPVSNLLFVSRTSEKTGSSKQPVNRFLITVTHTHTLKLLHKTTIPLCNRVWHKAQQILNVIQPLSRLMLHYADNTDETLYVKARSLATT